mmetsp:Transcript_36339/g.53118  ORF Transcript_36339/g.53118 Transcript_36339/m.53118 type:complete len:318 (-) Transcript_36339:108-1061(-)
MSYRQALKPVMTRTFLGRISSSSSSSTHHGIAKSMIVNRSSFSSLSTTVCNTTPQTLHHGTITSIPKNTTMKQQQQRYMSDTSTGSGFSFAGPRSLNEILRIELMKDKTTNEVKDLWLTYHESRDNVHGVILPKDAASTILNRASGGSSSNTEGNKNKCGFFISPIFRDSGFFMLVSQFMEPNHFVFAYLEDYRLDPARAQPLLSVTIFDELVDSHDITLVRCDVVNRGVSDHEAYRVLQSHLDAYYRMKEEFELVQTFNLAPNLFDVDDYISRKSIKWREEDEGVVENASSTAASSSPHVMDGGSTKNVDDGAPRP